jgi:hypothetical protein
VGDALRELLDVRRGQLADQVEFDGLGRQVIEQPSASTSIVVHMRPSQVA